MPKKSSQESSAKNSTQEKSKKEKNKPKGNQKLASQGKAIMARAHEILKANPGKLWKHCVRDAGKEMKKSE